jgi:molybdopterin molybdotransferase
MAETISLADATSKVLAACSSHVSTEDVALDDSLGRRLAVEVRATEPWPSADRSAMDGYAVVAGAAGLPAGSELAVAGESLAGHPFAGAVAPGQAIRIMTGGVVPPGADAVVAVEDTSGFGGPTVGVRQAVRRGQNIRPRGSEVQAGQVLIAAGSRIRAAEIGALAVLGMVRVSVFRRPQVAILSTGDEVVDVERVPAEHQVRNSNAHALAAQVRECGGEPVSLGIARDDPAELRARIDERLARADVLLTIGGVSKGTHDLVHGTLAAAGVRAVFHGIELKPGKPTFFGLHDGAGRRRYVFGLPGNPASCFTVFDLLVQPLLARTSGAPAREAWRARLAGARPRSNSREQAIPGRLVAAADGGLLAQLEPPRPSGDPFSLLHGDGYALLPARIEPQGLAAVEFRPYADGAR